MNLHRTYTGGPTPLNPTSLLPVLLLDVCGVGEERETRARLVLAVVSLMPSPARTYITYTSARSACVVANFPRCTRRCTRWVGLLHLHRSSATADLDEGQFPGPSTHGPVAKLVPPCKPTWCFACR